MKPYSGARVASLYPARSSITARYCRFRFAQVGTIGKEDLLPISNRTVKDILDLGRFDVTVYFPHRISGIRVLQVSIALLGHLDRLVADKTRALYRIAPDNCPLVPCFCFRVLELRQCRGVCSRQLRLKLSPLQVNERRWWIEHFRIQTRNGVQSEDFGPLLHNGIALHLL